VDCSIVENLKMESNTPQQKNNSVIPPVFISAAADVSFFIGYVLIFHALGMLIKFVLTSDPWDPWSGLWNMFLDVVGEEILSLGLWNCDSDKHSLLAEQYPLYNYGSLWNSRISHEV